jgi:hypothetical protein
MSYATKDKRKRGSFNPTGKICFSNDDRRRFNPVEWSDEKPLCARLIVGFNVGKVATWSMEDLIALVKEVREKQGELPDSTFVYQRGMFTYSESGETTEEEGGQVIIFNFSVTADVFQAQMVELGEIIARRFEQKSVILEIQRAGIVQMSGMVTP